MNKLLIISLLLVIGCKGQTSGVDQVTNTIEKKTNNTDNTEEVDTNNLPVSVNSSVTTTFNNTFSFTLSASDQDSDGLTYYLVDQPAHGSITCTNQSCSYVPDTGYSGSDSLTFLVNDGTGDSNTSTVSISIGTNPDACGSTQNPMGVDSDFIINSTAVIGSVAVGCTGSHVLPMVIYDNGSGIVNGIEVKYTKSDGSLGRWCYLKSQTTTDSGQNRFIQYAIASNCSLLIGIPQSNIDNKEALLTQETYVDLKTNTNIYSVKF